MLGSSLVLTHFSEANVAKQDLTLLVLLVSLIKNR